MIVISTVVGIIALGAILLSVHVIRRLADLEQTISKFRLRVDNDFSSLTRRVEWISKSVAEIQKTAPFSSGDARRREKGGDLGASESTSKSEVVSSREPASTTSFFPGALPSPEEVPEEVIDEADEYVNFDCEHCGQNIEAPKLMIGMKVACPTCGKPIEIPPKSTSAPRQLTGELADKLQPDAKEQHYLKGVTMRINLPQLTSIPQKSKRHVVIRRAPR